MSLGKVQMRRMSLVLALILIPTIWAANGVAWSQPGAAISSNAASADPGVADRSIGKWRVEFTNGVVETCEIREDGLMSVVEPLRGSAGKVTTTSSGALLVIFEDDRVERWTRCGQQMIVEHWFPASRFSHAPNVLGIGQKTSEPSSARY